MNNEKIARVISINVSKGGIPKLPVDAVLITESGLNGDGHNHEKHYNPIQAVCLQDIEKLKEMEQDGYALSAGATGENLTVENLNVNALSIGTTLNFEGGVVLEVSKVRKPCYVLDEIDPMLKEDIEGRCGMYAKVIHPGDVKNGEAILIQGR